MSEKNTQELEDVLGKTHISEFNHYCKNNKESMGEGQSIFDIY